MLEPLRDILKNKEIVLASGSASRQEAMRNIGLNVKPVPSNADENLDTIGFTPEKYVETIALRKVLEVEGRLQEEGRKVDLIIGADTVVSVDGNIYLKPRSKDEAFEKLKSLKNRRNEVFTGVVMKQPGREPLVFTEMTSVLFGDMTEAQIRAYIETGEPMRCAGGYAIQGRGGTFIKTISGNYFNVLGLPVYKICEAICRIFKE